MEATPKSRRKVFVRRQPSRFSLQPDDIAVLRDVAEYRFLNTAQIAALNPTRGKRNLLRRLAAMFDLDYLERPKVQANKLNNSPHLVYSLGRKGAEELAKDAPERWGMLQRVREAERTSSLIAHALLISQFGVCLTLALKGRSDVRLTKWMQGDELKRALYPRGATPELVPDALFILQTDEYDFPFFLEADRANMSDTRFLNKLRIYWRWNKYGETERSLGFPHFRVLTITPKEGRCESLRRFARDEDEHTRSGLFLFAPATCYGISNPIGIFEAVWKSPKDDALHAIVE